MEVTRDVILDLLPVYLMGEASPATRALVEEYLKQDPELAARVRASAAEVLPRAGAAVPSPVPELELASVARTRGVLARMRWLFAIACTLTGLSLSFHFTTRDGGIADVGFLLSGQPVLFAAVLAVAAACWIAYFRLRRSLGARPR